MKGLRVCLMATFMAAAMARCVSDEDCSLNGVCSAGACQCNPAWTGPACATMRLEPAAALEKGAAYGYAPNVTSWGGNPVLVNGTFHLFVTEILYGCHLKMWQSDSSVTHAVASSAAGPYTKKATALLPEAHNPQVVTLPDGSLAMFHIGGGDNSSYRPCSDVVAPPRAVQGGAVLHTAPGPDGPWQPVPLGFGCNNPAPMVHLNGSVFLLCNEGRKVLHRAPSVKGPWEQVAVLPGPPPGMGVWEDPFLFIDRSGHWHALMHAWDHQNDDAISGHLFSRDGLAWNASDVQPFGNTAQLTDGSVLRMRTRERPKLLFDAQGNPTHLFNGVNTNPYCPSPASSCKTRAGYDWDYTFVQPIAVA